MYGRVHSMKMRLAAGWSRYLGIFGICVAWLGVAHQPAWAEYKLKSGDILVLTIVGMPDLATKAMVDADGNVNFPLAGEVAASGLSVAAVKSQLQAILPTKELVTHLADGRQVPAIIAPVQVSLAIAEYRPVYVDGDVAKPGAVTFRPGLTVRQAISLAGGRGPLSRTRSDDPSPDTLELTGRYNEAMITFAKTQVRIARLQAELDKRADIDPALVADLPVAPKLRSDIVAVEQQLLTTRRSDAAKEQAYLSAASKHEQQRATILDQQEAKDSEGMKIDEGDLQRLEELFKKGAIALPTISEARRTVLQSSTRALQTSATLASVQRDQGELDRRLERLDDTRKTEILLELAEAEAKLAATRTELQTISSKQRYAGTLKPQVASGIDQVRLTIVRGGDSGIKPIDANLDSALEPGDSLQVAEPVAENSTVGQ